MRTPKVARQVPRQVVPEVTRDTIPDVAPQERLYNMYAEALFCENTRHYMTSLPGDRSARNAVTKVPKTYYGEAECALIRSAQLKSLLRRNACRIIVGPHHTWGDFQSGAQANQGGFMRDITLDEAQLLRDRNPVVFIFGTASVGGRLHLGSLYSPNAKPVVMPIVRTHGVRSGMWRYQEQSTMQQVQVLIRERAPLSRFTTEAALRNSRRRQETIEQRIDTLYRAVLKRSVELAARLQDFSGTLNKASTGANQKLLDWCNDEIEKYDRQIEALGQDAVSLQQIQSGYEAIAPGARWKHGWELYSAPLFMMGLMIQSMYHPRPVLGGNAAAGCGAHLRTVYRISIGSDIEPPDFDVLLRVEPFMPLQLAISDRDRDDEQDWDHFVAESKWYDVRRLDAIPKTPSGGEPLVVQALRAWRDHPKDFDMNYVPGLREEEEDED